MSTNSLLNADENLNRSSNKTKKTIVYGLLSVLLITISVGGYWFWFKSAAKASAKKADKQYSAENLRNSVVMFLAQPQFSGQQFAKQILGPARLELFQMDKKEIYFSLPEMPEAEAQKAIDKFIVDPNKIEKATVENGKMRIGKRTLEQSSEQFTFFKTPLENFKVDPETSLGFEFERAKYTLNLRELIDFSSNAKLFGGRLNADANMRRSDGKIVIFANHGSFVAKPDEPSLKRLVNDLLQNSLNHSPAAALSREQKIQRLIDFVSNEIEYDYSEALSGYETLKRPNETLMSRTADCSNKTILLASLLEQIGEDYLLLYCPEHITVAVLQKDFPAQNRLTFVWDNKTYVIAESTLANFKIGETFVQDARRLKSVQYVQIPSYRNVIFDASTMHPVEFH